MEQLEETTLTDEKVPTQKKRDKQYIYIGLLAFSIICLIVFIYSQYSKRTFIQKKVIKDAITPTEQAKNCTILQDANSQSYISPLNTYCFTYSFLWKLDTSSDSTDRQEQIRLQNGEPIKIDAHSYDIRGVSTITFLVAKPLFIKNYLNFNGDTVNENEFYNAKSSIWHSGTIGNEVAAAIYDTPQKVEVASKSGMMQHVESETYSNGVWKKNRNQQFYFVPLTDGNTLFIQYEDYETNPQKLETRKSFDKILTNFRLGK